MRKVALIVFLLFLVLNVAAVMAQCPTCQGTGTIDCPYCNGYGYVKPTISNWGVQSWASEEAVFVNGTFENEEDVGVYGVLVAKVEGRNKTYTNISPRTYFPPQERLNITLRIEVNDHADYLFISGRWYLDVILNVEVEEITCSYCDGAGFVTCPDCGGTTIDGEVSETIDDGGTSEYDRERREQNQDVSVSFPLDLTVVGVGVVAAVAIGAIVVVKRKKVTEKDLRMLAPIEFQNWVVQRLSGKAASGTDSRIGIDACTAEGHPIQIRQSDNIGINEIENFASLMGRIKAKNGVIIAFSFADDAIRGIVRARVNYGVEIKKITVKELIERRNII
jgi:hypothetical protein